MLKNINSKIQSVLKKEPVCRAGIFGSYARGEQKKNSDIDILVEVSKKVSLLDLVRMKNLLEKSLGRGVDLVEYCTIKSAIKKKILGEEIRVI